MAVGFKVADAYVAVHTEDDTRQGRRDIERDTTKWADKLGNNLGRKLLHGLMAAFKIGFSSILSLFGGALKAMMALTKFALIAGVAATAIAGLASAVGGLVPILAQLVVTLQAAAGALLLYPAVIATVIGAVVTMKLALKGVGDAFKALASDDVAAFEEALKKLAPEAQKFLRAIKAIKPAWDALRLNLQNKLFANLAQSVRNLARVWFPDLNRALGAISKSLNAGIREGFSFLLDTENKKTLVGILYSIAGVLNNVVAAFKPLLGILTKVISVSTGVLASLTGGLEETLNRWDDRLGEMAADGSLRQVILDGVAAVKQLFGLLKDVWGILKGIFNASGAAGGLFSFFHRLNEMVNSIKGQAALVALFENLKIIGKALEPVLWALVDAIGMIAIAIKDIALSPFGMALEGLIRGLGKGIAALAPGIIALAPVLGIIGNVLPAVGQGISDLLVAFGPGLITGVAALANALMIIVNNAGPLGQVLGDLVGALGSSLPGLVQILVDLIVGLGPGVVDFVEALGRGLLLLAPAARPVAEALSAVLTALAPLLPVLGALAGALLQEIAYFLTAIATALAPVVKLFAEWATRYITKITPLLALIANTVLPKMAEMAMRLFDALAPLTPVIFEFIDALVGQLAAWLTGPGGVRAVELLGLLIDAVVQFGAALTEALIEVLRILIPMLPELIPQLLQLGQSMTELAIAALPLAPIILEILTEFLKFYKEIGGFDVMLLMIQAAIGLLSGTLRFFLGMMQQSVGVIRTTVDWWKNFFKQISDKWQQVKTWWAELPGKIKNAVANFGTLLVDAGKNLIQGLKDGIKAMVPSLDNLMGSIAQSVRDFWPFSPAKKGPLSGSGDLLNAGKQIPGRLAQGIGANRNALTRAMEELASLFGSGGFGGFGVGGGSPALALAGAGAGAGAMMVAAPSVSVTVQAPQVKAYLGDKELKEVVVETVQENPTVVSDTAAEGDRQNSFLNPRRKP